MPIVDALPNVSLRQLQYVVAVADLRGFRRAADACHVAQPSLSAQVALVERQLGVQLFERDRRSVRISARGAVVIDKARRILIAAGELGEIARQARDPFHGTLRLGVIPTIGPYLLPDLTPALTKRFPSLSIQWTEARTQDLIRELREGSLDALLLALEAGVGNLEHVVITRDAFVLAAAARHPIVKATSPVNPGVLDGASVLLLDDGHCFRDQVLSVCEGHDVSEQRFRATSLATLVQMVSAGNSVTLLPMLALPVENRRGHLRVRAFTNPAPGRTIALAWRRGSAFREALQRIGETVRGAVTRQS